MQADYITDEIYTVPTQSANNEIRLNKADWDGIFEAVRKNYDYFNDNKRAWINFVLTSKFTNNYDLIPSFAFPITNYLTIMQSTIYDRMTTVLLKEAKENQEIEDISLVNFRSVLQKVQYDLFLNGVGFVYIINKGGKIVLKNIKNYDIVYNYDFSRVCIKARAVSYTGSYDEQIYLFDYYEQQEDGKYKYATFQGKDFFDLDFEKGFNSKPEQKKALHFTYKGIFEEIPVAKISKYTDGISRINTYVQADEILNVLISFGLAGVPMSIFVKIFVKNSNFGNGKDKLGGFSDLFDILQLHIDEDAGKVDTGDLSSFKNFFAIFEAILGWFAQMIGLNQSVVSSKMNEVRKSGASKFADSRSGQIFRDHLLVKFDEFEDELFTKINSIRKGKAPYKFKLIDKNTSILSDPNDLADYFSKTVKERFEGYIPALAKIHKVTYKEAVEIADKIKEEFDKYFPSGFEDKSDPNMMYGLKKKTLSDDNFTNDNEDDANIG